MAKPNEASALFWDAFTSAGSMVTDCVCGRTHFSTRENAGSWEEGELDTLLQKANESPDRYVPTSDDSVAVLFIEGNPVCYGCPCATASRYEQFLINHQISILDYYRRVAARKRDESAKAEAALLEIAS